MRPREKTELRSWLETAKWVIFGVLAPELLVFVAWRQYVSAMALNRIVRRLQESEQSSAELPGHDPLGKEVSILSQKVYNH